MHWPCDQVQADHHAAEELRCITSLQVMHHVPLFEWQETGRGVVAVQSCAAAQTRKGHAV